MQNQIIEKSKNYVEKLFTEKLSKDYLFHDMNHTLSVQEYSRHLGKQLQISDSDLELLEISALFHDTGYTEKYQGHEEASIRIAESFLKENNYPENKIETIKNCIKATNPEVAPQDQLQEIIKDADLNNLGTDDFFDLSIKLRHEWDVIQNNKYSDLEWLENNLQFLKEHKYYTSEAKGLWNKSKKKNQKKMKTLIKMAKEKALKEKSPIEGRKSTQMMFKTSLRNHIDLTGIADNKANMMLQINALIITIAMPLLATSIQDNKYLLIPSGVLLITCISTLIFATLATRPIKMMGNIKMDSLKEGNSNVFFFGNFYEMTLNQYREAVDVVVKNDEILDKSIVNDLYYLGKALGNKYSQLRTCYLIFMTGMTLTVVAFVISFLRSMP